MYWFLFLMFRFVLRRDAGAVGIADILLVVLIADASQNDRFVAPRGYLCAEPLARIIIPVGNFEYSRVQLLTALSAVLDKAAHAEAKQLRGQALSLRRATGSDRERLRQHEASEDAHLLGCLFSQIVRVMHVTTSSEKSTDQSVFSGCSTAPSPRRRIA